MNKLDQLFWDAFAVPTQVNYPPYNIIKIGDDFKLEFAVAGFKIDELDIDYDGSKLVVSGSRKEQDNDEYEYIHRSLSKRDFKQTIAVRGKYDIGDVYLEDGILIIEMKDKTERVKPKIAVR